MVPGFIRADLRLAVRSIRRHPGATIASVLTLSLGIGATTAIFSVANGLALRTLPVQRPRDLVTVTSDTALRHGFQAGAGWSYAMWDRLRDRATAFDGALAWTLLRMDLSEGGETQPVNALVASGAFLQTLGVPPLIGRTFTPADDVRGGGPDGAVAVIGQRFWRRRFGGSPDVLGSRLLIDQKPLTIVGVAPERFMGLDVGQRFDIAIPFGADAAIRGGRSFMSSERSLLLTVMLRLKPGQSVADATVALRAIQPHIVSPGAPAFLREPFIVVGAATGISDRSRLRQQYQYPLVILSIISGVVLVIVCLNVASLLISRTYARRTELGVRLALGAPPWRLARQQLAEALIPGAVGTAGGILVAAWAGRALLTQIPLPGGPVSMDLAPDWRVFAFTAGVGLAAVVLVGIVPAIHAVRVAPIEALRGGDRGAGGRSTGRLSSGLIVTQIALSIVLVAGAGLFVRTLIRLVNVPLGFDPSGVLVIAVNTTSSTLYQADPVRLQQRMLEAVRDVPGVIGAAGSLWTPVGTGGGRLLTDARGRRAELSGPVAFNVVTPGWFDTYRTVVVTGRDFTRRDDPSAPRVAIVNESLHRALAPDRQPVGSIIDAGPCSSAGCTVVGVVADAVYGSSLRDAPPPAVYTPLAQSAGVARPDAPFHISLRVDDTIAGVIPNLSASLRRVDPGLTFAFRRLEDDLDAAVAQERLLARLAAFYGAIALLLSGVGVYGLSSYAASRRRAEIGIRLALGGQPRAVVRTILGRLVLPVVAGTAVGMCSALWLARYVAPLLYGLEPGDHVTLVASASSLALVAGVSACIPAWRATRVDPVQVLRQT